MTEQQQAMQNLRRQEFSAMDAALFLDTHPTDEAALQYWRAMQRKQEQAQESYQKNFSPLSLAAAGKQQDWDWIKGTWPWEWEE